LRAEAGVRPARRTRAARSAGRRQRLVRRLGKVALATALVLVLLALVTGFVFAGSASHIAAGVKIAGVNVGGLTAEEAQARLEEAARRSESVPVVFTAGGATFPLRPSDVEARGNWAAAVDEALEKGDGPVPLRGLERVWLRAAGANVEPTIEVYDAALDYRLEQIGSDVDEPAREAALMLNGLEPEVVPGRAGLELDRDAAAAVIVDALGSFEREETPLPVAVDRPEVTQSEMATVAAQTRTVLSAPVKLTFNGAAITVTPREMARLLDLPSGGQTDLAIDERAAARRLRNVSRGVARPPRNADFAVNANGRVRVVASRAGRKLDLAATSAALLDAASRTTNRSATLVIVQRQPETTTKEARALRVERQLASYTTLYSGTSDRITNLQLAINLLDGARIAPGATWSFNERVGPRTEERGFRSAPVIIDGEYEEGIGGGVSQVATTVFNAAWESGIKIAERTAHALYISRYPTGRDATVNYPDVDLKLRNDTNRWIVIKAGYDESGIVVRLLGAGPERRVESIAGELKTTGPPKVERIPDATLFVGERVVVEDGEPSRSVSVERIVYVGDKVLYQENWYTGYRSEKKVVRVGTKPQPAPPPEEKPKDDDPPTQPGGGGGGGGGGRR
jgi:vancomycin resistance protein YoaR